MKQTDKNLPHVFLHTGDVFLGVSPTMVSTVLGSCLAITMHSPKSKHGIICHSFLPCHADFKKQKPEDSIQICRYVDTAVDHLLDCMLKLGNKKSDLQIKLFGGACGLNSSQVQASYSLGVGPRNIVAAKESLKRHHLSYSVADVGGSVGRKILFATHTGVVWLKRLEKKN